MCSKIAIDLCIFFNFKILNPFIRLFLNEKTKCININCKNVEQITGQFYLFVSLPSCPYLIFAEFHWYFILCGNYRDYVIDTI